MVMRKCLIENWPWDAVMYSATGIRDDLPKGCLTAATKYKSLLNPFILSYLLLAYSIQTITEDVGVRTAKLTLCGGDVLT